MKDRKQEIIINDGRMNNREDVFLTFIKLGIQNSIMTMRRGLALEHSVDFLGSITLFTLTLSGEEEDINVGEDTAGSNGSVGHELVEFLVVSDGELDVSGHDSGLLVVLSGVASKFEHLSSEIFEDGSEINGSSSSDSLGVSSLLEESGDSSDGELKSSFG